MLFRSLAAPLIYLVLPPVTYLWYFDVTQSTRDHQRIRQGERLPIVRIGDIYDFQTLSAQASSVRPYEPLFGYYLETFTPAIHAGDIHDEDRGTLNMTNPASLVFPELNGLRPFDRIRASDRRNLERFAARQDTDWNIPPFFRWLNLLAVAALAASVGIPLLGTLRRSSTPRRPRG